MQHVLCNKKTNKNLYYVAFVQGYIIQKIVNVTIYILFNKSVCHTALSNLLDEAQPEAALPVTAATCRGKTPLQGVVLIT